MRRSKRKGKACGSNKKRRYSPYIKDIKDILPLSAIEGW